MESINAVSYFIHFNQFGYQELNKIIDKNAYSSIFILVDNNTLEYCYPIFAQNITTETRIEIIQINAGEEHKNLDTCQGIWGALTDLNADRKSLVITLGGGVITDIGGFIASTFKRGIDFINIPTTLLAMVDASVGGKTGIDFGVLKNQIGVFANPKMVLVDPEFLQTLAPREIRSGSAEIIKYGLTHDRFLYDEIIHNNKLNIVDLIHRSIEIKNEIVTQDPKEKGLRKVLNFGHTIGHAIESYFLESTEKEKLTHGEAIAIGMICECYISTKTLKFSLDKASEIKKNLIKIFGKTPITEDNFSEILTYLKHDKKNVNGNINCVLLNELEQFEIDCKITNDLVVASLYFYNG